MSLFPEYALTPDLFLEEKNAASLKRIYKDWLRHGLVRNLYDGQWRTYLKNSNLSPIGKEVLKYLGQPNRLMISKSCLPNPGPTQPQDWCQEALKSHANCPLNAILVTDENLNEVESNPLIVSSENYSERDELRPKQSLKLKYSVDEYCHALINVFRRSPLVCFIDPYINPDKSEYRDFPKIFDAIKNYRHPSDGPIKIQIHLWDDPRLVKSKVAWQNTFEPWGSRMRNHKLSADVHLWSKFQNRYFLCSFFGLAAGKGFKSNKNSEETHHWTRLEKEHADAVGQDFETNGNGIKQKLKHRFTIG